MFSGLQLSCFKLENSTYCPEYNGHYVLKRGTLTNTKEFDNTLQKYLGTDDSYKKFLIDNFNCTGNNLPEFRYKRSFLCSNYIVLPFTTNDKTLCEDQISEDKSANTIPFCYSSCMATIASLEEILMDNTYGCSQSKFQNNFNGFKTSCYSWYGQADDSNISVEKCFLGNEQELKYCGYSNESSKQRYCQQKKSITEPCCDTDYKIPNSIYVKGESSTKIPIILFSITVILSTVITILIYIYRHNRKLRGNTKYHKQEDEDPSEMSTKLPYDGDDLDEANKSYSLASSENSLFYVFHEYIPKINDEIQLNVGDIVKITKIFDDGWAYGTNISTDCEGALPMACCMEYRTSISSMMMSYAAPERPVSHRASSLFTTS